MRGRFDTELKRHRFKRGQEQTAYQTAHQPSDKNKKAPKIRGFVVITGGEGGIRTLGTLQYA